MSTGRREEPWGGGALSGAVCLGPCPSRGRRLWPRLGGERACGSRLSGARQLSHGFLQGCCLSLRAISQGKNSDKATLGLAQQRKMKGV